MRYAINTEGGQRNYEESAYLVQQTFDIIERASSLSFEPIEETDDKAGTEFLAHKVIGFGPDEDFRKSTVLAHSLNGIVFNQYSTKDLTRTQFRGVLQHELFHNFSLKHVDARRSIMYSGPFPNLDNTSLLWRKDLIKLWEKYPNSDMPIGYCSADEDKSIMIPAVSAGGKQWALQLRWLYGETFAPIHVYEGEDWSVMEEKAFWDGEILTIKDLWWIQKDRLDKIPELRFSRAATTYLTLVRD